MPKKKQQYIYVAREHCKSNYYYFSNKKIRKVKCDVETCTITECNKKRFDWIDFADNPFPNLKLKKGEQKRHPIEDDKWEDVN